MKLRKNLFWSLLAAFGTGTILAIAATFVNIYTGLGFFSPIAVVALFIFTVVFLVNRDSPETQKIESSTERKADG